MRSAGGEVAPSRGAAAGGAERNRSSSPRRALSVLAYVRDHTDTAAALSVSGLTSRITTARVRWSSADSRLPPRFSSSSARARLSSGAVPRAARVKARFRRAHARSSADIFAPEQGWIPEQGLNPVGRDQ